MATRLSRSSSGSRNTLAQRRRDRGAGEAADAGGGDGGREALACPRPGRRKMNASKNVRKPTLARLAPIATPPPMSRELSNAR